MPLYVLGRPGDVHVPNSSNVEAKVTYSAAAGKAHVITGVAWSYDGGAPGNGRLRVIDGGLTIFDMDIASVGHGSVVFPEPKSGRGNRNMEIILTAGGPGVTGKVNVLNHWTVKA